MLKNHPKLKKTITWTARGAALVTAASLSLELIHRNTGAYAMVEDLRENGLPKNGAKETWKEISELARKAFLTQNLNGYPRNLKNLDPANEAENITRKHVTSLRGLEVRSGGLDDQISSMEIWPILKNKLTSFGPLQIQSITAAKVYLKYWDTLSSSPIFNSSAAAPSEKEISELIKKGDSSTIRDKLDLCGYGGVVLGLFHYLDLYCKYESERLELLQDNKFLERCKNRDDCKPRALSASKYFLRDRALCKNIWFSAPDCVQFAATAFNAGENAIINSSLQGLINEICVLDGIRQSIVCDGSFGTSTKKAYEKLLQDKGINYDKIKAANKGFPEPALRLYLLRELWFNSYERKFSYLINEIYFSSTSEELNFQIESHQKFKNLFLGDSDPDHARGVVLQAVRHSIKHWINNSTCWSKASESEKAEINNHVEELWLKFLDHRDRNFLNLLDPQQFSLFLGKEDPKQYGKFMGLLLDRVLSYHIDAIYHGDLPTQYRSDWFRGDNNPFARGYLMSRLAEDIPEAKLQKPVR